MSFSTVILFTLTIFQAIDQAIYQATVKNSSLEWVYHPFEIEQCFSCFRNRPENRSI